MNRRRILQTFPQYPFLVLIFLLFIFLTWPQEGFSSLKKNPAEILKNIYDEVKELGPYADENFLRREFHMDLDNNAINKEEYVMVLSQNIDNIQKMVLQVTYFEQDKNNRFVKNAKETKEIKCELIGEDFKIKSCDYEEKKLDKLLSDILTGIQEKKRLLKLVKK
ncbi:MAG: hypothetical protein MUP98_15050 [Candidatus Aminicenantes bacterium]|nr:hypothetical protein [Candidatus Aminicenantes bacterium]